MRLTRSKNVLHFSIRYSKSIRFLELRPRPRWGAYGGPPDPLIVRDLFVFGACTFPNFSNIFPTMFPISVPPKVMYRFTRLCIHSSIHTEHLYSTSSRELLRGVYGPLTYFPAFRPVSEPPHRTFPLELIIPQDNF